MDNIIDRAIYPLPEQETEAKSKRRMGLGLTGVANAIEILGYDYGSQEFLSTLEEILITLRDTAYTTSVSLAVEKGPFPLYEDKLLNSSFAKELPEEIRKLISLFGLRNSHLLSIAPTGTISLSADNVSSGIEPVFSHGYERTIQSPEGPMTTSVKDFAWAEWEFKGKSADTLSVFDHVNVLNLASKYVDSACSKTCNVGDNVTWEDFKEVYMKAYKGGASGCTTFRAAGKRYGILNAAASEEEAVEKSLNKEDFISEGSACYYDVETGVRTCE